ncbi:MAG: glycosyltransferase family 2 protein [Bacteroidales bacterium]|nr:glycosyltransferase family 2 protein [Bacteroidales bacterium]
MNKMDHPLVSIITVNFNHPEVTCALLASLRKITYPNIEVIVIDNASPDDDPSMIIENYPEIQFIQSKVNLGFAGGNNIGTRIAKGKYVLFINNDTEVEPGFLEPLVDKCESNPSIGGVSPKIRFYSKPDTIQYSGFTPINPYTIRSKGVGFGEKDKGQYDKDSPTPFVHGAAMMVPMEVIRKVGMMAESYFLYYEELDWGARIRRAGFELWYVGNSLIMHKESISTGKLSPFKTYYINRARLLYLRRNVAGAQFFIALLFQTFVSIPKNILTYLFKGEMKHLAAYSRAVSWHLQNPLPGDIHSNPLL